MRAAGLGALGGQASLGGLARASAAEDVPPGFSSMPCKNTPFGGPVIPGEPGVNIGQPKALFDPNYFWKIGQQVVVRFINPGGDSWHDSLRDRVMRLAPVWTDYANLSFRFIERDDEGPDHITINFGRYTDADGVVHEAEGEYWSYLGTDALEHRDRPSSMCLMFDPDLAHENPARVEEEFSRVILHEFGHALGLIHEHKRPDRKIRWLEKELRAHAKKDWRWEVVGKDDPVKAQILDVHVPEKGVLGGTTFDPDSIMMYEFPVGLAKTTDDKGNEIDFVTNRNVVLSARDKVAAAIAYPIVEGLGGGFQRLKLGADPEIGSITNEDQVAYYSVEAKPGQEVTVTVTGIKRTDLPELPALVAWLRNPNEGRGLPGNILEAREAGLGSHTVSASVKLPKKDKKEDQQPGIYFIEIRAKKPLRGMRGAFTVQVS